MVAASRARMTPKRKRLWLLLASLCVLGAAATLVLTALLWIFIPKSLFPTQDTGQLFAQLLGSSTSRDTVWQFVQTNWTTLTDKLGVFQGMPAIARALDSYCSTQRASEGRS